MGTLSPIVTTSRKPVPNPTTTVPADIAERFLTKD